MKGLKGSTVGNSVLYVVSSQWRKIESHAVPGHVICFFKDLLETTRSPPYDIPSTARTSSPSTRTTIAAMSFCAVRYFSNHPQLTSLIRAHEESPLCVKGEARRPETVFVPNIRLDLPAFTHIWITHDVNQSGLAV